MRRYRAPVILAAIALGLPSTRTLSAQPAARAEGVTITYLANEGVLLSSGAQRVLIDGLFLSYGPEYALPADSTQAALARGSPLRRRGPRARDAPSR